MSTKPLSQQVVTGADGAESANAQDGAVRPRDSLFHWCGTADSVRRTNERGKRCSLLDAYFGPDFVIDLRGASSTVPIDPPD